MNYKSAIFLISLFIASALKSQDSVRYQSVNLAFEKEKLQLEKEKLKIEQERLYLERNAKYFTAGSILLPLLTALIVLLIQKRATENLQKMQADVDFQIKATEIILASKSSKAAKERATILNKLFPKRISESFVEAFDKENLKFPGLAYQEKKLELFKALSLNSTNKKEVLKTFSMIYLDENIPDEVISNWETMFPEDIDWTKGIKAQIKAKREEIKAQREEIEAKKSKKD